jgi:GTPase SAR1 family protein
MNLELDGIEINLDQFIDEEVESIDTIEMQDYNDSTNDFYEIDNSEEDIILSETEITETDLLVLVYKVINSSAPDMISLPLDSFLVVLSNKITELFNIIVDPETFISDDFEILKDFISAVRLGVVTVPTVILGDNKLLRSEFIVVADRQTLMLDTRIVEISGKHFLKGKPVILVSRFNSAILDNMFRQFYKYNGNKNILDYLEDQIVDQVISNSVDMSFELMNFSNLEIAELYVSGEVTDNDLHSLPENRQKKIYQLTELMN